MHPKVLLLAGIFIVSCSSIKKQAAVPAYATEKHRPQVHFTPKAKWMNDPNGMVFSNGTYHLMYQYYPDSTIWGPMHWGHATSKNLVHWSHQPIAFYPDSLGYIFSGSAVIDVKNTSGFGTGGKPPMVAIFTHHDPAGAEAGSSTFQNQSIAYSLDEGKTWTKYSGNPVLKNPGIRDFRDPKVSWHEETSKWIMTLATLDRITFYSSSDLKEWTKESEFGKDVGAHGGVWECPDLFPLELNGERVWILLVSINPGGPNGGSATQYFTGKFDGRRFTPFHTDIRWIDHGPDNYAGVTWSNTGKRKIFMGWMSNWQYANVVPTKSWRSAMTLPRELSLERLGEKYFVRSTPVHELEQLAGKPVTLQNIDATDYDFTQQEGLSAVPSRIYLQADSIKDFTITFLNKAGQKVMVGYETKTNLYFIDRSASGNTSFEKGFAKRHTAPRIANAKAMDLELVLDNASLELFADNGLTVMTEIFFPDSLLSRIHFNSKDQFRIKSLTFTPLESMYKKSGDIP
jgi:fructan beta-fructosidase